MPTLRRKFSICLLGTFVACNSTFNAGAALCEFKITYNTKYTAKVYDTAAGTHYAYITPLTATQVGGDDLSGIHPSIFETYCLDLGNTLATPAWWESGAFPNPNSGSSAGNPIWTQDGIYKAAWLYETYGGAGGDAVLTGAALQLAIWEVLYEDNGNYNVLTGSTYVINNSWNSAFFTDGVATLANNYLIGVQTDKTITGTWWNAMDQRNQDLIGPYVATPEPTTMVAGAMLLLPFLASTLRRRLK